MPYFLTILTYTSALHVTEDVGDTLVYSPLEDFLQFSPIGFVRHLGHLPDCI